MNFCADYIILKNIKIFVPFQLKMIKNIGNTYKIREMYTCQSKFSIIAVKFFFSSILAKLYCTDNADNSLSCCFPILKTELNISNSFDKHVLKTPLSSV